jgi:nicotinate-nucleotide--dimethylbenzimidazole phosphoribosyltransferase
LRDYLFFGHESEERFHSAVLAALKGEPVLRLGMRLGEGTGAALAMQVMEQALACYHEMATFEGAGVSNREL